MRILFTSVGRRVELVQAFKNAAKRLDINLTIYGADMSESAPAMLFCDVKKSVCGIDNPDYISQLFDICENQKIDALIPTIDTDLLLLSRSKDQFAAAGTKVLIGSEDKIRICRDKRETAGFFAHCGLKSPATVDDCKKYEGVYPCFIKPRDGSSSINAFKVYSPDELEGYARRINGYIIQPFIEGTEYTVDIFCDFDGNPIYITPRERIAVRSGEVLKTRIRQDEKIKTECGKLLADFNPCGPITVQLIKQEKTGEHYYLEINPRFGGGAPLSMKAGADSAEAMIRLLRGEKPGFRDNAATDGLIYSRFDQSICINEKKADIHDIRAVIFDLDDTLYSEKEYVRSGFKAIAANLPQISHAEQKLWKAFADGKQAVDTVLSDNGLCTEQMKKECLDLYRGHTPDIRLYDSAKKLLESLRAAGIKTGIITDGRPEEQRHKIKVMGLEALIDETIVTDELGGVRFRKPNDIAFRIMQCRLNVPFENMIYVGDNPQKDFSAPLKLSMQTAFFDNPDGLYSCRDAILDASTIRLNGLQNLNKLIQARCMPL